MFRELTRKKQQLTQEDCIALLKSEKRGVLSVLGDDGYPYGVPLNHYYVEETGRLYFHSGKSGHKIDAFRTCPKASFCVYDSGFRREGEWALNIRSVIAFGQIHEVEDPSEALSICADLSRKFTDDEEYIRRETAQFGKGVLVFYLEIEHLCGKQVNES